MLEKDVKKLVGDTFEDMTLEDMAIAQGSGEAQPRFTPALVASVVASSGWCGAGAATGSLVVLSIKRC